MNKNRRRKVFWVALGALGMVFLSIAAWRTKETCRSFWSVPPVLAVETEGIRSGADRPMPSERRPAGGKIRLEVTNLRLRGAPDSQEALTIPRLRLEVDSSSLLRGDLLVERLVVSEPTVPLVRDRTGQLLLLGQRISQWMDRGAKGDWTLGPFLVKQVVEVEVQGARVELVDQAARPSPTKIAAGVDLTLRGLSPDAPWQVEGNARLLEAPGKSGTSFHLAGTLTPPAGTGASEMRLDVKAVDPRLLWPFASFLGSFPSPEGLCDAELELEGTSWQSFRSRGTVRLHPFHFDDPRGFRQPIDLESALLKYQFSLDEKGIDLQELRLETGEMILQGKMLLDRLPQGKWQIAAQASSSPFDFEDARRYLPWKVFHPKLTKFLEENVWGGRVSALTLRTQAKTDALRNFKEAVRRGLVTAEFAFDGPSFKFSDDLPPIENITGLATMKEGKLLLQEMTGSWQTSRITRSDGILTLFLHDTPLDLTLDIQVDLEELRATALAPTEKPLPSPLPLLAVLDRLEGQADLRLRMEGQAEQDYPDTFSGELTLRDATLSRAPFPLSFTNLRGVLVFSPDHVETSSLNGRMGSSPFHLQGTVADLRRPDPRLDLRITSPLEATDLRALLPDEIPSKLVSAGPLDLRLLLQGTTQRLQIDQDLNLKALSRQVIGVRPPSADRDRIAFQGVLLQEQGSEPILLVDRLQLSFLSSEVEGRGRVSLAKTASSIQLALGIRHLDPLAFLRLAYPGEGYGGDASIQGKLDLKGPLTDPKELKATGKLEIHAQELLFPSLVKPLDRLTASLDFVGTELRMTSELAQAERPPLSLVGDLSWQARPRFNFYVTGPELSLDDLFPQDLRLSKKVDLVRFLAEQIRKNPLFQAFQEGRGQIGALHFRGATFRHVRFSLAARPDVLELRELEAKINGGIVHLQGDVQAPPDNTASLSFHLWAKDIHADAFLQPFRLQRPLLSGTVSLGGNLSATGEDEAQALRSARGNLSVEFLKGRLHRLSWLSKVFSLLNIYQLVEARLPDVVSEGMPYDWIKGDFTLKKGVAHTENLLLVSPSLNMSAVGDVRLAKGTLKLLVGVQPFQTIDRVVGLVPFVDYILLGEDERLLVAYFMLKGPLAAPRVTPRPVDTVSKGVLGIVTRTITLPIVLPQRLPGMIKESVWDRIWNLFKGSDRDKSEER